MGFIPVLSILAMLAGLSMLSEATLGVGVIASGCCLGILGRIVQAEKHHKAVIAAGELRQP